MPVERVTKEETEADLESRVRAAIRVAFALPDGIIKEQIKFSFKFGRQTLKEDASKSRADAKLDVLLELADRPLAVMELKRPGLALTEDDAEQGLSYARLVQPPAPLVVVTNGTEVKFYETYSGKPWVTSDKSETALKALFESASRVAAGDLKLAVDTLMGTTPSVWMQAVRLVSAETIDELTASWNEPARPFIEDFLSPRLATQQLRRHFMAGERLLVLEGTPLAGKSNVLRELCLQTYASDDIATLYIDAGTGGGSMQALADALARSLEWPVTPQEARDWLVRLSNTEGRRLVLALDGLQPGDESSIKEVEDLSSSTFGPSLSVAIAVDEAAMPQLLRTGNRRADSAIGRRAKVLNVGPLLDREFILTRQLLARRRVHFMPGAEFAPEYRQPWVLRSIVSEAHATVAGASEDEVLSLPPLLGLHLIKFVRQRFIDEGLRRIFRGLAKALLKDAQDSSRPAELALAQVEHTVLRRDALSKELDRDDLQWLFDHGFARAAMHDTIGPTVWVRLPELLASELAYLIGAELVERSKKDMATAAAWLVGAASNLPLGEIICAQAIVDIASRGRSFPVGIFSSLVDMPPEREVLSGGGHYGMLLPSGEMVDFRLRGDGSGYITIDGIQHEIDIGDEKQVSYKNIHAWMILSHIASVPFEFDLEDGPVRGDAMLLLQVGTCPIPLRAGRGDSSLRMMPTTDFAGGVSVVHHDAGIVEAITLGIMNYLTAEVRNADAWLEQACGSGSIALLYRIQTALGVLAGFETHARSEWAKQVLLGLVTPALHEAIANSEATAQEPEEGGN